MTVLSTSWHVIEVSTTEVMVIQYGLGIKWRFFLVYIETGGLVALRLVVTAAGIKYMSAQLVYAEYSS
jgi:hypothetical protein